MEAVGDPDGVGVGETGAADSEVEFGRAWARDEIEEAKLESVVGALQSVVALENDGGGGGGTVVNENEEKKGEEHCLWFVMLRKWNCM